MTFEGEQNNLDNNFHKNLLHLDDTLRLRPEISYSSEILIFITCSYFSHKNSDANSFAAISCSFLLFPAFKSAIPARSVIQIIFSKSLYLGFSEPVFVFSMTLLDTISTSLSEYFSRNANISMSSRLSPPPSLGLTRSARSVRLFEMVLVE